MLMSEERARAQAAVQSPRHEELQVVTRLREETRGYASHEIAAHRENLQVAAKQNADPMSHLQPANEKKSELEHQLQNYARHVMVIQQQVAAQFSQFEPAKNPDAVRYRSHAV